MDFPEIATADEVADLRVQLVACARPSKNTAKQILFHGCGEDQRRRQGLAQGDKPPQVILPVIWAPVEQGYPDVIGDLQADQKDMPKDYFSKGRADELLKDVASQPRSSSPKGEPVPA